MRKSRCTCLRISTLDVTAICSELTMNVVSYKCCKLITRPKVCEVRTCAGRHGNEMMHYAVLDTADIKGPACWSREMHLRKADHVFRCIQDDKIKCYSIRKRLALCLQRSAPKLRSLILHCINTVISCGGEKHIRTLEHVARVLWLCLCEVKGCSLGHMMLIWKGFVGGVEGACEITLTPLHVFACSWLPHVPLHTPTYIDRFANTLESIHGQRDSLGTTEKQHLDTP